MPILLLGIPLALATGALAFNSVTNDTRQTANEIAPSAILIGALIVAGIYFWRR